MKDVALVTGEVSPYRREPFRLLAEREGLEVLAWRELGQLEPARRIAAGRYRAVICGLGGRVVLPASYLAARRAHVPFVLWASIWAHPRTPAHALSYLPTRWLYRHADAVVTYGRHVSEHVGRTENVFEAPQAPEPLFFERGTRTTNEKFTVVFAGRLEREKGVEVLLEAWRRAGLTDGVLEFAGDGPLRSRVPNALGPLPPEQLRARYAAADAVVLPSIDTATFREPWGLVLNEAMLQGAPVIASDAVGAVAGGLVRDGRNGLVVPAGDADALAARLRVLAADPGLRERLGEAAREDALAYTPEAWANAMSTALEAVGAARPC
ncbi:MAG: glycosyltransferase family 4 protein [Thermoleophilaceae bacterium]